MEGKATWGQIALWLVMDMISISWLLTEPGFEALLATLSTTAGTVISIYSRVPKHVQPQKIKSYSQRLTDLRENLTKASSQVDNILVEIAKVAEEREKAVRKLNSKLAKFEGEATAQQKKIQELKDIPTPVADYFAELIEHSEKNSATHDYLLFLAGIVVSIVLSLIFG